jgi:tetratricopeptide (TPR) repeat protein
MDRQRQFEHAFALMEEHRLDEALEEFHKLAADSDDLLERADATLYGALALRLQNDYQRALLQRKLVRSLLSEVPRDASKASLDDKGRLELRLANEEIEAYVGNGGEQNRALAMSEEFMTQFRNELSQSEYRGDYEMAQARRGILLAQLGNYRDATPILEEAEMFHEPFNSAAHWNLGSCYYSARNYAKAISTLKGSIDAGIPDDLAFTTYCYLGRAHYHLREYMQAKRNLEKTVEVGTAEDIKEYDVYHWLDFACQGLGLIDEANLYSRLAKQTIAPS